MSCKFELRIDKIQLRGLEKQGTRSVPSLQEKYIARAGGGTYMAVAASADAAIKEVLRTMRMHYRRLGVADSMGGRITKALETPVERVSGSANDIRIMPVDLLAA